MTRYRCPVCGCPIVVTEQYEWEGERYTAVAELQHDGPGDAACRLVLGALADEIKGLHERLLARLRP